MLRSSLHPDISRTGIVSFFVPINHHFLTYSTVAAFDVVGRLEDASPWMGSVASRCSHTRSVFFFCRVFRSWASGGTADARPGCYIVAAVHRAKPGVCVLRRPCSRAPLALLVGFEIIHDNSCVRRRYRFLPCACVYDECVQGRAITFFW